MKRLFLLLTITSVLFGESFEDIFKEGQKFAKSEYESSKDNFQKFDKELFKDADFDGEAAIQKIDDSTQSEYSRLIQNGYQKAQEVAVHPDEAIFNTGENIESEDIEDKESSQLITCQQSGHPYKVSFVRELQINIPHEEKEEQKFCLGHLKETTKTWKKDAKKKKEKWEKKFKNDPSIAWYTVEITGGGMLKSYTIVAEWKHKNNTITCDRFKKEDVPDVSEEQISEEWICDDKRISEISSSQHCTFIGRTCLEANKTKWIKGKEFCRDCWKEQLSFLCQHPKTHESDYLKSQNCTLVEKKCLQQGEGGCALWELTFKCGAKVKLTNWNFQIDDDQQQEDNHRTSFPEVSMKLYVLDEMKRELSSSIDPETLQIFRGKVKKCARSIADKLMYDCCFSHKGLAKDLDLAHCNTEELELAECRERGMCHYLGSYSEKIIGIKTRDIHVYCCFPSKLSRILHENIRDQLKIDWGTPKHPQCRGLTVGEISQTDFSKMDLSEAYELCVDRPSGYEERLNRFGESLKKKLEKDVEDSV